MKRNQLPEEAELRSALDRAEFQLHYQPIVELESSRIVGFEALLRWMHPNRGVLYPSEFLGAAGKGGMASELIRWALRELGQSLGRWQAGLGGRLPFTVSMNIPVDVLASSDFVQEIDSLASENGFAYHSLRFELTEDQLLSSEQVITAPLLQLKERGVRIILDNFGALGSELRFPFHLPVCAVKVDSGLISRQQPETALEWVRGILARAHSLGLERIAKGLERADQLRLLRELGCEYGQGYYFHRPQDQDAAFLLLAEAAQLFRPRELNAACLRRFPLFEGLAEADLNEIASHCKELAVPPETLVIRQGQVGDRIYFLEEGSLSVYHDSNNQVQFLGTFGAPTVVGEMAIVDPERIRTANVRSLTPLRLLSMPITTFLTFLRSLPTLAENFRQLLASRSR